MVRTQIHLSDEDVALLDEVARRTGASRAELIRRAVQRTYGGREAQLGRRRILRETAGAWSDREFTGAEYVDAIRGDLDERLAKLGYG